MCHQSRSEYYTTYRSREVGFPSILFYFVQQCRSDVLLSDFDGIDDGLLVGSLVGSSEGIELGSLDGTELGFNDGTLLGAKDGSLDGIGLGPDGGNKIGTEEGSRDGSALGSNDGVLQRLTFGLPVASSFVTRLRSLAWIILGSLDGTELGTDEG